MLAIKPKKKNVRNINLIKRKTFGMDNNEIISPPAYHSVFAVQMKNWDPFVLGPEFAIDRTPTKERERENQTTYCMLYISKFVTWNNLMI